MTTWRRRDGDAPDAASADARRRSSSGKGLLTALLNPKVALFQLASSAVRDPANGSVLLQSLLLAATQSRLSLPAIRCSCSRPPARAVVVCGRDGGALQAPRWPEYSVRWRRARVAGSRAVRPPGRPKRECSPLEGRRAAPGVHRSCHAAAKSSASCATRSGRSRKRSSRRTPRAGPRALLPREALHAWAHWAHSDGRAGALWRRGDGFSRSPLRWRRSRRATAHLDDRQRPELRGVWPAAGVRKRSAEGKVSEALRAATIRLFCLTEPHVGSDAAAIGTRADRDGEHWVLNGVKQFITTGKNADVAIVFAVTDKTSGKKGISGFVVDTKSPGFVVARVEEKLGQRASDTAQIVFENCRVPTANLWGAKATAIDAISHLEAAASACGAGRGCKSGARAELQFAREGWRSAAIAAHQAINSSSPTWRAARGGAATRVAPECARCRGALLKTRRWRSSSPPDGRGDVRTPKSRRDGYVADFPVAIYRDVRFARSKKDSEIQRLVIGRALDG